MLPTVSSEPRAHNCQQLMATFRQTSTKYMCVTGSSYGCNATDHGPLLWVVRGCRGTIDCGDHGGRVTCGDWRGWEPAYRCRCKTRKIETSLVDRGGSFRAAISNASVGARALAHASMNIARDRVAHQLNELSDDLVAGGKSSGSCFATIVQQHSIARCVAGKSFGWHCGPRPSVWIARGCRGVFALTSSAGVQEILCDGAQFRGGQHNCSAMTIDGCPCVLGDMGFMPQPCTSCDGDAVTASRQAGLRRPTTVAATVLHYEQALAGARGRSWYYVQVARLQQLIASLALVGNEMQFYVLSSGEQEPRVLAHLAQLPQVRVRATAAVAVPSWAPVWYKNTFQKLAMLNLSLELGSRVLYMDTDVTALAPVDQLRTYPAPAFVFYPNDMTPFGINSGVMLLHVRTQAELEDAMQLYAGMRRRTAAEVRGSYEAFASTDAGLFDGSDQTFWTVYVHRLSRRGEPVHELSRRFNLLQYEDMPGCGRVASGGRCKEARWEQRVVLWHKLLNYKPWGLAPSAVEYLERRLHNISATVAHGFGTRGVTVAKKPSKHHQQK